MENSDKDEKKSVDKSSTESSPRDVLAKADEDNVTLNSSSESSPRDGTDHQDGNENDSKSLSGKSSSQSSNTVSQDKSDDKNVPRGSSPDNSPRDIVENDASNLSRKSSSASSPRDANNDQNADEKEVAHMSNSDSFPVSNGGTDNNNDAGLTREMNSLHVSTDDLNCPGENVGEHSSQLGDEAGSQGTKSPNEMSLAVEEDFDEESEADPVFDGTEVLDDEGTGSPSVQSIDRDLEASAWPEKAAALKNFVKVRSVVAVSTVIRRLSGRKDDDGSPTGEEKAEISQDDPVIESKPVEVLQKECERSSWNPLNYIRVGRDADALNRPESTEDIHAPISAKAIFMKGRIIVYTRLGCPNCREVRLFLRQKRLKYVEINIDIYPSRKMELEKNTGSSAVPRVYFNDFLIGGLSELKDMDVSGMLDKKINDLMNEVPPPEAPSPPHSGEDDESGYGKVDDYASIVRKMKETIVLKDRFYKMRRFKNCFLGSEAADFLSEDQYLEREEAVEFGRTLASKHFFQHVLDENVFEDGNHVYRFLENDPVVTNQCYNIQWGIIEVKPKPISDISSRLRFLASAIFEAHVSEDGRHVDYRTIHGSEEFQRYLRITEELQRVVLDRVSREEKLAFFINLYNMMAIHAILTWGYPVGTLDRRRFLGDFKYVVGGCAYSLSAIQNGILRANQRPPYNLMKPFGPKDKRFKIALPYLEPLVHFALVCGTRSGPALRCYSPGNIDKELVEAARDFMRNGGLIVDAEAKAVSASKILRWYSVDFGRNEIEVLKHAANYLDSDKSAEFLELLATSPLKVTYQPYYWDLNT